MSSSSVTWPTQAGKGSGIDWAPDESRPEHMEYERMPVMLS